MIVRRIDRVSFTEYWITVRDGGQSESYAELAAFLAANGVEPLAERAWTPPAARQAVAAARQHAFARAGLDPEQPWSCVGGRAEEPPKFGGIQLWGIAPRRTEQVSIATVGAPGTTRGRLLRSPAIDFLWLPGISGQGADPTSQARAMFSRACRDLQTHGFRYSDVVRTWIHIRRILDWYDDFNRIRNEIHAAQGLDGTPGGTPYPASTGVQGVAGPAECVMDLLAARAHPECGGRVRHVVETPRQGDARAYGSGFSRAVVLELEGGWTILLSGTASIDREGRTVYPADREGQVVQTLLNASAAFAQRGAGWQDVVSGTVYCTDEATETVFHEVTRLLGLEDLPFLTVRADLCRHDLFVELEAVAAAERSRPV